MIFKIPIPTFHEKGAVWILFCSDAEADEFSKKVKFKNTNLNLVDCSATTFTNGFNAIIRFKKDPINNPALIAHELLHAVFHFHRYAGVLPSESSEEGYAYFLDYLVREFYKRYNKANKDANRRNTGDFTITSSGTGTLILPVKETL